MTEKQKEWLVGGSAGVLLLWILYHLFHKPAPAPIPQETSPPVVISAPGVQGVPNQPLPGSSGGDCSCGSRDCALSPNQIPSYQQILSAGYAAANQIYKMGNDTLNAVVATNTDPFLHVKVIG